MRSLALLPLLMIAACSDGGDQVAGDAKAKAEAAKNLQLAAGQWQITSEVTRLTEQDGGPPAINTPVGSRHETSACVTEGEGKKPKPVLLAGHEDYECEYSNFYMSSGTVNAQLNCRREGLSGEVRMTVDGTYTADTITAEQSISTFLSGNGDVNIQAKLTGRHTGPTCAPAADSKEG
jgi:hypothetical protein